MTTQSSHGVRHYAYAAAAIIIASIILSASLIVAPALETTKTSIATSTVTTTVPPTLATSTLSLTSTVTSVGTITSIPFPVSPCDHLVWNLTTSASLPVLLMRPNSTGYICMTYHVSINTYRSKPDQLSPIHIGRYSCVMVNGENQCLPNDSH